MNMDDSKSMFIKVYCDAPQEKLTLTLKESMHHNFQTPYCALKENNLKMNPMEMIPISLPALLHTPMQSTLLMKYQ